MIRLVLFALAAILAGGPAFAEEAAAAPPPVLDTGNTAWMLISTALVLMMTIPGVALFYGGMVRKKNVLATVMQSFAVTCVISILWVVIGYSLAFTEGVPLIGGTSRAFLSGVFAVEAIGGTPGLIEGNSTQVLTQLYGVAATIAWSALASFIILKLIDLVIGLRVSEDVERDGLDFELHGESVP